jgi:hypothetical protein
VGGGYLRGELEAMREHAADFLREIDAQPQSPEAGVSHRVNGITNWCIGDFAMARDECERALAIFDSERDSDLAFRFGHDAGVGAMTYQALALWPLGEVDDALRLIADAQARTSRITHIATLAYAYVHAAMFEIMRGDFARAAPHAIALGDLARENDLKLWGAFGVFLDGWSAWRALIQREGGPRCAGDSPSFRDRIVFFSMES